MEKQYSIDYPAHIDFISNIIIKSADGANINFKKYLFLRMIAKQTIMDFLDKFRHDGPRP